MIHYTADGAVVLFGDADKTRTQIIPPETLGADREAAVAAFFALEPPPTPPASITDRQFGRGLWGDGIITFDECEDFVATGLIPAALKTLIDSLPDDDTGRPTPRKEAIIFVRGAKSYERANPFVDLLGHAYGWSVETLNAKWMTWSTL